MALKIQTTGIEQYAPGGQAVLKTMFIGGPGAGKTRLSSYWPKPLYADCEGGLSSIADRKMPFVTVSTSQDMLDLLAFLKMECRRPVRDRTYQTVVIDTLDAFQRKVKDEWLQANPGSQSFRGFDAWGYLDAKMQMLLTRLLNLDMNVIVCVHYKDKTIKEGTGENATERQELMLQLSGEVKDNVFNDFDLVGWIGKYYEAVDGQRVEKRGLTFKSTPEKPFLKDRLHVTPAWMEVRFSEDDYGDLFAAFAARLDDLEEGQELGEIPSAGPEQARPGAGVVGPGSGGGALPPQDPRDIPLAQYDKPTLQKLARELGCEFRANTIKSELIEMVEKARAAKESDASSASPAAEPVAEPTEALAPVAEPARVDERATSTPVAPTEVVELDEQRPQDDPGVTQAATPVAAPDPEPVVDIATEVGKVNPATGEVADPTEEEVAQALGGQVISVTDTVDTPDVPPPSPAPAAPPTADDHAPMALLSDKPPPPAAAAGKATTCEQAGCDKPLADENQDYVKLSQIKFRAYLCNEHYIGRKKTS